MKTPKLLDLFARKGKLILKLPKFQVFLKAQLGGGLGVLNYPKK